MSSSASRLKKHCKTPAEVITVRVRNESGTKRIQIKPSADWADLIVQFRAVFSVPTETLTVSLDPKGESCVPMGTRKRLSQLGIENGTMLYLKISPGSANTRDDGNEMDCSSPMETSSAGKLTLQIIQFSLLICNTF